MALILPRASLTGKGVPNECTPANLMSALVPKVTRELTRMRRTLRETFGLDKLRPGQAEVMRSVLEGNNTLAIMPTGAGKSLCYQLPSLHLPGTTVVVSPLISLMKDQVDALPLDQGVEDVQVVGVGADPLRPGAEKPLIEAAGPAGSNCAAPSSAESAGRSYSRRSWSKAFSKGSIRRRGVRPA